MCGTPTSAWAWRVPDGRHPVLIRVCQQHETPGAAVIANLVTKIQDLQYQIDTAGAGVAARHLRKDTRP